MVSYTWEILITFLSIARLGKVANKESNRTLVDFIWEAEILLTEYLSFLFLSILKYYNAILACII